ncbi:hypothetical protein [Chromobacterium sinusclupearum]|uniref:hypothetical protein n=1 Tax=Chromobacterium sinusclupearum TaxID=2077146 RepID=UPI0011AFBDE0|nr:hypothetical protein [Chromobacterium sinusclupearum]
MIDIIFGQVGEAIAGLRAEQLAAVAYLAAAIFVQYQPAAIGGEGELGHLAVVLQVEARRGAAEAAGVGAQRDHQRVVRLAAVQAAGAAVVLVKALHRQVQRELELLAVLRGDLAVGGELQLLFVLVVNALLSVDLRRRRGRRARRLAGSGLRLVVPEPNVDAERFFDNRLDQAEQAADVVLQRQSHEALHALAAQLDVILRGRLRSLLRHGHALPDVQRLGLREAAAELGIYGGNTHGASPIKAGMPLYRRRPAQLDAVAIAYCLPSQAVLASL